MWSFVFLAVLSLPAAAQQTSPVPHWIASHAIRLATPEAGRGFADMQPLKKVIGDARIVSLGEATHGTREFFQLKHRMLEFLASEMGFTIFSIEANMPEAYRLNDYVLTGRGDAAALLKGMYFWTWNTEEVLDMIRWMRQFNQSGKGRIAFTGFDMQTPTVAEQIVADFVATNDPDYVAAVKSATGQASQTQTQAGGNFGVATATFPVSAAAGKTIRFSGYIKTSNVADGYAGLWWRVDGPSGTLAFDNMQKRGVTATTDWKEYSIELPVTVNAKNINFGALFPGKGTAWFDDLKVEIDGQPYEDSSHFDLGFESASPRGFYTGGNGYHVALDNEIFHSGKQSLRMQRVSDPPPPKPRVDPAVAAGMWKDIISHLEAARPTYREKRTTDREIDWVIQNARVVLQCMQMRGNQVSRDQSMADNVKWIADHSAGAKIVLWAHNGHVRAGGGGYESMGAALRHMFGAQMVVFGFAFNQGSFQAIGQGKNGLGILHDFTVPPAPAGSLDATLAAAGIPLLALDLRQAPKSGPVANWWKEQHQTRSIGAVYPEDSPFAMMADLKAPEAFDALLFVANTTAARKNPPAN
jgi:erythromycin esterase-like protein